MKSMTGFAQGRYEFDNYSVFISFKSFNHRYLETSFKGYWITPKIEKLIKEVIKDRIFRGKLEIIFDFCEIDAEKWHIQFNEPLVKLILDKLAPLKEKYRENATLSLDALLRIPKIFHLDLNLENFSDTDFENIRQSVEKVFESFEKTRIDEGSHIFNHLMGCIKIMGNHLRKIEKREQLIEEELFNTYKNRISRLAEDLQIDEKRIAQEAAILSEKISISEEISRLKTHTERLNRLLKDSKVSTKGKEANFLSQEMQRESHTIAAKTPSLEIHQHVLHIRREIEKIRQQVQNIE